MKRRHVVFGLSGAAGAFLVLAIVRLLVGNGVLWHFIPWHL